MTKKTTQAQHKTKQNSWIRNTVSSCAFMTYPNTIFEGRQEKNKNKLYITSPFTRKKHKQRQSKAYRYCQFAGYNKINQRVTSFFHKSRKSVGGIIFYVQNTTLRQLQFHILKYQDNVCFSKVKRWQSKRKYVCKYFFYSPIDRDSTYLKKSCRYKSSHTQFFYLVSFSEKYNHHVR